MRDFIALDQRRQSRTKFVESLNQKDIEHLASSYHNDEPCRQFRPYDYGAFNVCFFVEFDGGDHWVVQIPIPSNVHWVDEKVEVQVATMKYVSEHSTIPVPEVRAFGYDESSPINLAFVIMEYVQGKTLFEMGFPNSEIWKNGENNTPSPARQSMNKSLAQLYSQMRELEFPRIGALGFSPEDLTKVEVRHRPLSVEAVLQHSEGLGPNAMLPRDKTFATASDYVHALLRLDQNLLNKSRSALAMYGDETPFAFDEFHTYILHEWLKPEEDAGPFVLCHGDLGIQNLLWDDNLNLVSVLDWDFSAVVPAQFLLPPLWLAGDRVDTLSCSQTWFDPRVQELNACLKEQNSRLDWSDLKQCPTLIAYALQRPEYIRDVFWWYLRYLKLGFTPQTAQQVDEANTKTHQWIDEWQAADDDRKEFLQRKKEDARLYHEEAAAYFAEAKKAALMQQTVNEVGSSSSESDLSGCAVQTKKSHASLTGHRTIWGSIANALNFHRKAVEVN